MKSRFSPDDLDHTEAYKLLIGLVVPRPIGWIGSLSPDGVRNVAPFSFFNAVASTPPTVLFSTGRPAGRRKDTLNNVEATGEFTVNVVTEEVAEAMNLTSGNYPPDTDEFDVAGLTPIRGEVVAAPLVAEAKANFECRATHIIPVGRDPRAATVVIGEVVRFHVSDILLDGTRIDQQELRAIGRMGGPLYTRTREQFGMQRPD